MDVNKHIQHWQEGALEDLDAAEQLVSSGRFRQGLFFAHLAIEKLLKAHVTKATNEVAPRIHNLLRLAELAELPLSLELSETLGNLNSYQLVGRYPGDAQAPIDRNKAEADMGSVKELVKWLTARL